MSWTEEWISPELATATVRLPVEALGGGDAVWVFNVWRVLSELSFPSWTKRAVRCTVDGYRCRIISNELLHRCSQTRQHF